VLESQMFHFVVNNNNHDDIYGAVIMAQSHRESSPGSFGEQNAD